jgi:hypothetical protein
VLLLVDGAVGLVEPGHPVPEHPAGLHLLVLG